MAECGLSHPDSLSRTRAPRLHSLIPHDAMSSTPPPREDSDETDQGDESDISNQKTAMFSSISTSCNIHPCNNAWRPGSLPPSSPLRAGPPVSSGSHAGAPRHDLEAHHPATHATIPPACPPRTAPAPPPCKPPRILQPPLSRWAVSISWFQFPAEIRNMIYDLSLRWPDSSMLYRGYNARIDAYHHLRKTAPTPQQDPPFPIFDGKLGTPTIILLCRAITRECLPILRARKLVVDRLPPWIPGHARPLKVSRFIGRGTLQSLGAIDIRLSLGQGHLASGWAWLGVVDDLLDVLLERNKFRRLRVMFRMCRMGDHHIWDEEWPLLHRLTAKIEKLRDGNPNFWCPGVVEVEHWRIDGCKAHKLVWREDKGDMPVSRLRTPPPGEEDDEVREYPDQELWPGSIMEFL